MVGEICHSSWSCTDDVHQCLSDLTVCCTVTLIIARGLLVGQAFDSGMNRNTENNKIPVRQFCMGGRHLSQTYIACEDF